MYRAHGSPSRSHLFTPKSSVRFPPSFTNSVPSSSRNARMTESKPTRLAENMFPSLERDDSRMFGGRMSEERRYDEVHSSEAHQSYEPFEPFENYDEDDNGAHENESLPRGASSSLNFWNPSNFMLNTCFDRDTGKMYSRETCLNNISNAMKKKKSIDFLDLLQRKNTDETRNIAFGLMIIDTLVKRSSKPDQIIQVAPKNGFDLKKALSVDREVLLPGGKRVTFSKLIEPTMCTNWFGKTAVSKAAVAILEKVYHRDPFFLVYSSPESSRSTDYPRISDDVFAVLSDVLRAGFNMADDDVNAVSLASSLRRTTRNYIDKLRKFSPARHISDLLGDFLYNLDRDPRYRILEPPVELDDCHVDVEAHRKRLKRDIEAVEKRPSEIVEDRFPKTPKTNSSCFMSGNKDSSAKSSFSTGNSASSFLAEQDGNISGMENDEQDTENLLLHKRHNEKKKVPNQIKHCSAKNTDSLVDKMEKPQIQPMTTRSSRNGKK